MTPTDDADAWRKTLCGANTGSMRPLRLLARELQLSDRWMRLNRVSPQLSSEWLELGNADCTMAMTSSGNLQGGRGPSMKTSRNNHQELNMKTASVFPILLLSLVGLARAESVVTLQQGGVARWASLSAESCGLLGKRFPAVDGVCYYPADLRMKPGVHEIALYDEAGEQHLGSLVVQATEFPTIDIELDDEHFIDPSEEERDRHRGERRRVLNLFAANEREAQFSLPLKKPVNPLPESEDDFGSNRIFNGKHKSQHTGRDAPVAKGAVVDSVADGRVVLSEDHFYSGHSVFVDHGAGLISMFFHLSERSVETGDEIKAGDAVGKIGSTGRSTGPHMHIGMRWNNARIDPYLLFASPDKLPSVADTRAEAQGKIDAAEAREPAEQDQD